MTSVSRIPLAVWQRLPSNNLGRGLALTLLGSGIIYFMFQKKMLGLRATKIVSKVFFYPTLPITMLMRWGNLWTTVDDTVILGTAPLDILNHPQQLQEHGVRGVVNMCNEYEGPKASYARLGITQLHLPVADHFEPGLDYMKEAVKFIAQHKARGDKAYVHCKAGHGRGASIALCWMIYSNPDQSAKDLNAVLHAKRHVRKTLWQQENVRAFKKFVDDESEEAKKRRSGDGGAGK
jgi:atypical dual specificity phosphatase